MQSPAKTVEQYLAEIPEDRRPAFEAVRKVILANLPDGYQEGMMWGMITYFVPLDEYPDTYNKQPLCYIALANQKNYMTAYLMSALTGSVQEKKLRNDYAKSGKKLDFGKSCLRFKKLDDILLDTVGDIVAATPMKEFVRLAKDARTAKG